MARRRNREGYMIDLANALKRARDASKKSDLLPEGISQKKWGIVRGIGACFKGIDVNFVRATAEFGWLTQAIPAGGGRSGYFWSGPPKVLYAKQLSKIVEIRDRLAEEYKVRRAQKKAAKNPDAYLDHYPGQPAGADAPMEVVAVWSMPEQHVKMLEAYKACMTAGVEPPAVVSAYLRENNLLETDETATTVDILFGEDSYAKVMDSSGNVVSVDVQRMVKEHPHYTQILIRVGSARLHTNED